MSLSTTAPRAQGPRPVHGTTFAAVLFDMDGTLVDSTPSVVRSWVRLAEENGISVETLQAAAGHGRPARDIVADLFPPAGRAAALERITALEIDDVEGVVALPGAESALRAVGSVAAIVTSCAADLAVARQQAAGIPVPQVVVTADDVTRGKPDPEPFLLAARVLGVEPARCLVVEDAPAGLSAGRAAGMTTLAVTTTHSAAELDADRVVGDLAGVTMTRTGDGVAVTVR
ncbi:HAD-IA family hydrolase [Jannaschia sp. R86511]|uniref:HAD-IA family hydrolase n=1 Tax=Jannaschia sp. R86511 TaxID=3093853 RepID=UPI0036D29601